MLGRKNFGLAEGLARLHSDSEVSLATVLVSSAISMYRFQQQVRAAPTTDEMADKLSAIKRQLDGLASLAQGGKSTGQATPDPGWLKSGTETDNGPLIKAGLSAAIGRTSALHPLLQDILFTALAKDVPAEVDEIAHLANHARLKKEQGQILSFFNAKQN